MKQRSLSNENILDGTMFFVEATSYEYLSLWREFNEEYDWQEESEGYSVEVGKIANAPVVLYLRWAYLKGQKVCFYEGTSRVVDHGQIDAWLEKYSKAPKYDNESRAPFTDAMNMGCCLSAIQEAVELKARLEKERTSLGIPKPQDELSPEVDLQ